MSKTVYIIHFEHEECHEVDEIVGVYTSEGVAEKRMREFFVDYLRGYFEYLYIDRGVEDQTTLSEIVTSEINTVMTNHDMYSNVLESPIYRHSGATYYITRCKLNEEN